MRGYFSTRNGVDNPKNCVQYGGTTVAPIARSMLEDILPAMGIEKVNEQREKIKTWYDANYYVVEDYRGKKKSELKSSYFSFVYKGEGDYVVSQYPLPNEKIVEGSTIMIQLGGESYES